MMLALHVKKLHSVFQESFESQITMDSMGESEKNKTASNEKELGQRRKVKNKIASSS